MTRDLPRLRNSSSSEFARSLLCSAAGDEPPTSSRKRAFAAASLAASTVVAASGTAAAGVATSMLATIVKWGGVGFLAGTFSMGAAAVSIDAVSSTTPTQAASSRPQQLSAWPPAAAVGTQPVAAQPAAPTPPAQPQLPLETSHGAGSSRFDTPDPLAENPPVPGRGSPSEESGAARETAGPSRAFATLQNETAGSSARTPPTDRFAVELGLVDQARRAVATGRPGHALALLNQLERESGSRNFAPEAMAIRIEALARAGDHASARALARQFTALHPHHPLVPRVNSLIDRNNAGGK